MTFMLIDNVEGGSFRLDEIDSDDSIGRGAKYESLVLCCDRLYVTTDLRNKIIIEQILCQQVGTNMEI